MPKGLKCDRDHIVGRPAGCRVTPDFALSEYAGADGRVRVHRERVASVQVLRGSLGAPVNIAGVAPTGGLGRGPDKAHDAIPRRLRILARDLSGWRNRGRPPSATIPNSTCCAMPR